MADQATVERSCTKLRSAIRDETTNFTGDLQEMLGTLVDIQAAMPDNEMLSDGFKSEWVKKARAAAYGVSDLVDQLKNARTPAAGKMPKRVDLPENKMSQKMKEIKETLKGILKESIEYNVKNRASNLVTAPPGDIVGRDEDRKKIIAQLSAHCLSEEPIILLISGEEGVGKTTVAEMVFNDARFRCYSRVWVNNSYELHVIGKSIISQLSGEKEMSHAHASDDATDSITGRLHELLNGMKVVVVLDDLSMASYEWEPLKRMFSVDAKGTQVIVVATTTQTWTDSVIHVHTLKVLSEDMCCTIIKQLAGGSEDKSTKKDLAQTAPEIAKLCGGLPLAAKLFGRLLKFKRYEEWPTLLNKNLWPKNPVDLSLELSYKSMPSDLRLCFAYCTIADVPAHQRLVKEDLIHQWIALGLIEPSDRISSAIELAEEYITRLLDMSFLQTAKLPQASGKDDTGAILFKMHDSIFDFGRSQIEADLGEVYGPYYSSVTEHCRYVLIFECDAWPSDSLLPAQKISAINCGRCSKMKLHDDSFSVPRCLRLLSSEDTSTQSLPNSMCQLEQLGYLNLSGSSRLVGLPEIFGDLKNLLHIKLSGCSELKRLPESFGELKILRYINLSGCYGLEALPESFVTLVNLVHIDLSGCRALENLQEYFWKLANLMHLNLSGCSRLVTLPGSFGKLIKLVHIDLSNCSRLRKLPQSFGKLTSLQHINLSGCSGLVILPKSFGDLRNLLHIDLSRCNGLSKLPESFGKLQKLKHIGLSGCSGLQTLPESFGGLTNLLHIDLSRCCQLSKLPESFKNLRNLVYLDLSLWSCFERIHTVLGGLTSLEHLNLSRPCCYRADHIHLEGLKVVFGKLSRLQYLNLSMLLNPISYSQSEEEICEYIGCIGGLYSLEHLDLSHNIFLRDLPGSLSGLYRLHTLDLSGCIRLKKLGTWMAEMDSLKSLILRDCEGLESYKFEVGVDNNINNYAQLQEVASEVLEIICLEKMKCLEEAQRIKLEEKLKLQTLKLCWTPVKSVEENKFDRSVEEIAEPEASVETNRLDRSVEEIAEPEASVETNRLDRSVEEIAEPEASVETNRLDRSVEEIAEPEASVETNRLARSVEEIAEPEASVETNRLARSVEEIAEPEASVETNRLARSVEEIAEPEASVETNRLDRSTEEIEHEVSVERNKLDRPVEEIEHEVSVERIELDMSVEKTEPKVSVDKNRSVEEIEEPEVYAERNEPEVSVERNKTDRSAVEIEPAEVSGEKNKTDWSGEGIEPAEVSGEKKKTDRSAEGIEPAEVSGEKKKTDRSAEGIEPEVKNRPADSSVENDLLGALKPPRNVRCLELHGYRGKICQPSWLLSEEKYSDHFLNLVEVIMEDFPSCKTLPSFGLLRNLKHLVVRRMASVWRIDAGDLIGSNRPAEAQCTIELDDMPGLEEFNTTYNSGDKMFTPTTTHEMALLLHKCPRLRFGTLPPRFRRLEISESDQGMTSVGEKQQGYEEEGPCELVVKTCSMPISRWSLLDHLSVLRSLTIQDCSLRALLGDDSDTSAPPVCNMGHLTSLEELKIVSCQHVKHLWRVIQQLTSLKSLYLGDCKDLYELPEMLGDLTSLEKLSINRCCKIEALPGSISKLTNLKQLYILECRDLKGWCENKDNKKRLGHVRPTYELPNTSELGEQPKQS